MNKESLIKEAKSIRQALDEVLQRMKDHRQNLYDAGGLVGELCENGSEAIANHILSIRDVESGIMRQGMVLKNIGNPNPYPESYNPESSKVEPTADNLKL